MSDRTANTLHLLGCAIIALAFGWWTAHHFRNTPPEPVIDVRVDTLYVRDTLRVTEPVYVAVRTVDTMYLPVYLPGRTDTVWAELPREEKIYQDSSYRAVVSGYRPSLDTIDIYRRTVYVTKTETVRVESSPWSVGISAGFGASRDGLGPYIGVGVQYALWAPNGRRKAPP